MFLHRKNDRSQLCGPANFYILGLRYSTPQQARAFTGATMSDGSTATA